MAYARIEFIEGQEPQSIVYRYEGGEPEEGGQMLAPLPSSSSRRSREGRSAAPQARSEWPRCSSAGIWRAPEWTRSSAGVRRERSAFHARGPCRGRDGIPRVDGRGGQRCPGGRRRWTSLRRTETR